MSRRGDRDRGVPPSGGSAGASTPASRRTVSARPPSDATRADVAPGRADTFFGRPRSEASDPVPPVDVLLSGAPYDAGVLARPGARLAPRAVREASLGFGGYSDALGISVWDEIRAADGGDVASGPGAPGAVLETIARRSEAVARSGVIGGWVGGDQTITLGVLRGIHRAKLKSVAMVHIDASTDALGPAGSVDLHHQSVLRHAAEEGLVRPDAVIQVGVRGPHHSEEEPQRSIARGFEVVKIDDVKWDVHSAVSQIRKIVRQGSLYVSVDISALDPAYAPGASVPRPGGMNTWELQQILRALVGAHIVGFDVVEVSPPYDPAGITALAAASALYELLAVIADTHRSARPAPSSAGRRRGRRFSP